VGVQSGKAAAVTTGSAETLSAGDVVVSVDFQYLDFKPVSRYELEEQAEQGSDVHSTGHLARSSIDLVGGLSNDLTAGISLPYVHRYDMYQTAHHHDEAGGDIHEDHVSGGDSVERLGNAGGLGDLRIFGQYRWHRDPESGLSAAMLAGIKAPTGSTDEEGDGGERLETELQPGSGSWDVFAGVVTSYPLGPVSLDASLLYTYVTDGAQNTDLGDIFNYNLSLAYRLRNEHGDHHHSHLVTALLFEVNGEWRQKLDISGEKEANSGGNVFYLSPGLSIGQANWVWAVSVGYPIHDLNGIQSEPSLRAISRLTWLF
jgi:hypothetical protein